MIQLFSLAMDLVKDSFQINLIIMRITGLLPVKWFKTYYIYYAWFIYMCFNAPLPLFSIAKIFTDNMTDMTEISDIIFMDSQIGILVVKLVPFIVNPGEIQKTLDALRSDMFLNHLPGQMHFLRNASRISRRNFLVFWAFCLMSLITWGIKPLFRTERTFPMAIYTPFNPFENTFVYVIVYILVFCGVAHAANTNAAVDTLMSGVVFHAAAQIKILKDNLTNLRPRVNEELAHKKFSSSEEEEEARKDLLYWKICACVKHHQAIRDYVTLIENTYNVVLFTQFCASTMVICLSLLRILLLEPNSVAFIGMLVFFTTMLFEIFYYCYYGTVLYEESQSINLAIYMGDWYEYDIKSRKALIILMEGAKRPLDVTAGKILNVSLETFTLILKRSYSLLAVLKNYY